MQYSAKPNSSQVPCRQEAPWEEALHAFQIGYRHKPARIQPVSALRNTKRLKTNNLQENEEIEFQVTMSQSCCQTKERASTTGRIETSTKRLKTQWI